MYRVSFRVQMIFTKKLIRLKICSTSCLSDEFIFECLRGRIVNYNEFLMSLSSILHDASSEDRLKGGTHQ